MSDPNVLRGEFGEITIRYTMIPQGTQGDFSLSVDQVTLNDKTLPVSPSAYQAIIEQCTPIARQIVQLTKK